LSLLVFLIWNTNIQSFDVCQEDSENRIFDAGPLYLTSKNIPETDAGMALPITDNAAL